MPVEKKPEPESALYRVKNVSKGTRMIQMPSGKHMSINANETRDIRLSAHVARRHAQAAANRPGKYMEIAPLDDDARTQLSGGLAAAATTPGDTGGAPIVDSAQKSEPRVIDPGYSDGKSPSQELADRAMSMDVNELRSEARLLLADRWPRNGGTLTREKIKDLLLAPPA